MVFSGSHCPCDRLFVGDIEAVRYTIDSGSHEDSRHLLCTLHLLHDCPWDRFHSNSEFLQSNPDPGDKDFVYIPCCLYLSCHKRIPTDSPSPVGKTCLELLHRSPEETKLLTGRQQRGQLISWLVLCWSRVNDIFSKSSWCVSKKKKKKKKKRWMMKSTLYHS